MPIEFTQDGDTLVVSDTETGEVISRIKTSSMPERIYRTPLGMLPRLEGRRDPFLGVEEFIPASVPLTRIARQLMAEGHTSEPELALKYAWRMVRRGPG